MSTKSTNAENKFSGEKRSVLERVVFWVGSVAGILLSLIAIYEKVIEPDDAKLEVQFFESNSHELNITPSINTSIDSTEIIPFQVTLTNRGGKIAKHIKLYISYNPSIRLQTKYQKEIKRTWESSNESMAQVSLELEDLNPGESFLIPMNVILYFPREFQQHIARSRNQETHQQSYLPLGYNLNCDISSETAKNENSTLTIILGDLETLKKSSPKVFWVGHGDKGVQLLEVKEDFQEK